MPRRPPRKTRHRKCMDHIASFLNITCPSRFLLPRHLHLLLFPSFSIIASMPRELGKQLQIRPMQLSIPPKSPIRFFSLLFYLILKQVLLFDG